MLSPGAFRARATERIESPEQLDTHIRPARTGSWVALGLVLVALAVTLVWSTVSTVPTTVGGTGFFLPQKGWSSVQASNSGIVTVVDVSVNDPVVAGEAVGLIQSSSGAVDTVRSPITGYVVEVAVSDQEYVTAGTQMVVVRPLDDRLIVYAYVPTGQAHEIPVGAEAHVSPSSVAASAYGYLVGRVVSVAPFPATQQRLQTVLQNESLVREVSSSGPITEVQVRLKPARTPTGYSWSVGRGPAGAALTEGLPADVSIVVGSRHPISYIT